VQARELKHWQAEAEKKLKKIELRNKDLNDLQASIAVLVVTLNQLEGAVNDKIKFIKYLNNFNKKKVKNLCIRSA